MPLVTDDIDGYLYSSSCLISSVYHLIFQQATGFYFSCILLLLSTILWLNIYVIRLFKGQLTHIIITC